MATKPPEGNRWASGALSIYLREIARHPVLSREQEAALARRIRTDDHEAVDALVRANLRFVVTVAKRYQNRGLALEDLITEGNLGLLRAARRFDETHGVRFISYAVWWVRQAMVQALAEQGRMIRIPTHRGREVRRILKRAATLRAELGRAATPAELAEGLGLESDDPATLLAVVQTHLPLDAPRDEGESGLRLHDILADERSGDASDRLIEAALAQAIQDALAALPPRQALVLRAYFGFEGEAPLTLEEIGAQLGVSRERARQLKEKALAQLRAQRGARSLAAHGR